MVIQVEDLLACGFTRLNGGPLDDVTSWLHLNYPKIYYWRCSCHFGSVEIGNLYLYTVEELFAKFPPLEWVGKEELTLNCKDLVG